MRWMCSLQYKILPSQVYSTDVAKLVSHVQLFWSETTSELLLAVVMLMLKEKVSSFPASRVCRVYAPLLRLAPLMSDNLGQKYSYIAT